MGYVVNKHRLKVSATSITSGEHVTTADINVIKKLAVITVFFLICLIPLTLAQVIPNIDFENSIVMMTISIFAVLRFLNSAINPILYVWNFTEVRFQLKLLFCFWSPYRLNSINIERNKYFATYSIDRKEDGKCSHMDQTNTHPSSTTELTLDINEHG